MSCLKSLVSSSAGNTESGVVADCGSKELLVIAMMIMVNMKMMMMVRQTAATRKTTFSPAFATLTGEKA